MVQNFWRISQLTILEEHFDDIFVSFLLKWLRSKCQENEFPLCIVYILFSEVIVMVQVCRRSPEMIILKLYFEDFDSFAFFESFD